MGAGVTGQAPESPQDGPPARDRYAITPGNHGALWGKEATGQDVWTAALDRLRETYARHDHVYVSFSGGKDSTCVLHAALEVATELDRLPLRAVFFDEECISMETEQYVRRVAARPDVDLEWYCLPVQHRNACSLDEPYWWPWAPEAADRWARDLPAEAITSLDGFVIDPPDARPTVPAAASDLLAPFDRYGSSAVVMGIRAQESMLRHKAVASARRDNWLIPARPGLNKVYPVYDWTTADVWTAPALHGWDTNATYDLMEMAGVPHHAQRCAPPFGEEPRRDLWIWATCFPDLWDRMCDRVPGAQTAARYSRGVLFAQGQGGKPVKPDGETWREYVRRLLDEQPEEVRQPIAKKVRDIIRRHYRKTADPILDVPHPITQVSWPMLAVFAQRGDLKHRRDLAQTSAKASIRQARIAPYEASLAAYRNGELDL
jgi:predicted phosphoadenosine phosphosulfate sulfurtransferase